MSKVYLEDTNLTNIANAIRSKNGETTTYKPSEMATAISNIPSGGESVDIQDYLYFSYPFTTKPSSEYIDLSNAFTNGSYTFVEDTSLKVLKSNSNYNVNSGICYCYIKIDCTNTKAKLNIKSYVSSEANWDYGLIYYTKTLPTSYPSRSNVDINKWTVGETNSYGTLLGKNSGNNARIDIENKILEDGVYYLVYGYIKDSSGNTKLDRYFIEKINIEIGYDKYLNSDFSYAYRKYSDGLSILKALDTFKNENPNSKLNLAYCFDKSKSINGSSSLNNFKTYKDVFKNVVSYRYLFGDSAPSTYYGEGFSSEFTKCFKVDVNTIDLRGMFYGIKGSFSTDFSEYKTFNVKDMAYMFYSCNSLSNLDLSNFNTSNVNDMSYMFYNCNSLINLDISNFDTSNVSYMNYMFYSCNKLTSLDISKFDTSNVNDMSYMFTSCTLLNSIDISNFKFNKCVNVGSMFGDCGGLTNLKLGSNFSPKQSTIGMFYTTTNQNINIDMDGNTNFSSYTGSSTLNLSSIWRGNDSAYITLYENFANSLGTKNSSYTRIIKIYTDLYNALSSTQKALITNKGYTLSYGT